MDASKIECNNAGCDTCHPPTHLCAKCQKRLPWMLDSTTNHDGGMIMFFHGWYGGTIDPFPNDEKVLLCDDCATAFLRENAWLGEYSEELKLPA